MKVEDYIKETPDKMVWMIDNADELFKIVTIQRINRIVITGSGTSYHSGVQAQKYMQHFAKIKVDIFYPFMIDKEIFMDGNDATLVIGISQGGYSNSTYNAMKIAKESGCMVASMAGEKDTLIDKIADFILTVECGKEDAGPKTKGYHCTKLNLMLLALQIAKFNGNISPEEYLNEIRLLKKSTDNFLNIYNSSINWVKDNAKDFASAKSVYLIGTSKIYGDVIEGALKLLETLRIPVEGYQFDEFIHGIYNAINEESTIIILNTDTEQRVSKMVEVLSESTKLIYVLGSDTNGKQNNMGAEFINHPYYKTFEYIIPIQLICAQVPYLKGIDPNIPSDPEFHQKLGSKAVSK